MQYPYVREANDADCAAAPNTCSLCYSEYPGKQMLTPPGVLTKVYSTPCATAAVASTLSSCTSITTIGQRAASTCGDAHCFVEITSPAYGWVIDYLCQVKAGVAISWCI